MNYWKFSTFILTLVIILLCFRNCGTDKKLNKAELIIDSLRTEKMRQFYSIDRLEVKAIGIKDKVKIGEIYNVNAFIAAASFPEENEAFITVENYNGRLDTIPATEWEGTISRQANKLGPDTVRAVFYIPHNGLYDEFPFSYWYEVVKDF